MTPPSQVDRETPSGDERARSLAFAEAAQSRIRELGLSPIPRNYEIWYAYLTRINPELNKAVDGVLAGSGALGALDLERLYDAHFSANRTLRKMDAVNGGINAELRDVITEITGALGATSGYNNTLAEASRDLTMADDPSSIQSTVRLLVASTLEMRENSQRLESRLDGAMQEIAVLQQGLESIRMESRTDPLTELGNRKHFDDTMNEAIRASGARGEPLSLLMLDIDHFKSFNDAHGHLTGDQVLRLVAMTLKQNIKGQDLAARYGGEEFAVVLPNTSLKQAVEVANHIRHAVASKELKKKSTGEILGRITISAGAASLSEFDTRETFIERADSCLYAAKRSGRNRVIGCVDSQFLPEANVRVA
jgi:diguanylate cyclase